MLSKTVLPLIEGQHDQILGSRGCWKAIIQIWKIADGGELDCARKPRNGEKHLVLAAWDSKLNQFLHFEPRNWSKITL